MIRHALLNKAEHYTSVKATQMTWGGQEKWYFLSGPWYKTTQEFVIAVTNIKTVICVFVGVEGRIFSARVNGLDTGGKSCTKNSSVSRPV